MQLLRLQMRNFKRYRHQDVMFRDGITGILGNNGTGKSTIVDAILFCLYGVKETGLDYLISTTAGRRDRAEVRLDFSVRGEEYQLVRSLDQKRKHDVQLHRGGKLFARGVSDVQIALRKVIRMGHADFRHTIFSGQKELLTLVMATPEERKRWFRRVLGIDSLKEEGGEVLREEAQGARDHLLIIEGRIGDIHPETIEAEQEDLGRRITGTEEMIRSLERDLEALEGRHRALDDEIGRLRELEKEAISIRAQIRAGQEERASLHEELARVTRDIKGLGERREEFQHLALSEPGFEALRDRFGAGRERHLRFQALQAGEAQLITRVAEEEEALGRLREEDTELGLAEERLDALGSTLNRRAEVQGRLAENGRKEELYRRLATALAKLDEALSGAAKQGAELRSRMEKINNARARLLEIAAPYCAPAPCDDDPVALLDTLHRDLLGRVAAGSAARDQAHRVRSKLEADLKTLEARGTEGDCPTCHQPLGTRYREIVGNIEEQIELQGDTIALAEEHLMKAVGERAALESTLAEARRLQEVSSRIPDVTKEWEAVQEGSRRDLAKRDRLEQELISLAYDPEERMLFEREIASLEGPWREHVAISDRVKRRPALARGIRDAEEKLARLRDELATMNREREKLGFDPGEHLGLEKEYRAAEARHRRYGEMKPAMDRLPLLEGRAAGLVEKAEGLRVALENREAALRGILFSPEDLARSEKDLRSVQEQVLRMAQQAAKLQADLLHLEGEQRRRRDLLERWDRDRREHDRLGEEIQLLELTRDHLNGFTDHLLGVVRDQIQDETGRILSEITDGRYDTVILDDDFELLVHDLGGDFPVARFSGGEQDDIAIALRIALSRYIAEMHELHDSTFLIFDEIFGSQDEERRGNILRALRNLEPYFPQIFLISHVTEVQGEFGNALVVEAVSESESRIRDLEEIGA